MWRGVCIGLTGRVYGARGACGAGRVGPKVHLRPRVTVAEVRELLGVPASGPSDLSVDVAARRAVLGEVGEQAVRVDEGVVVGEEHGPWTVGRSEPVALEGRATLAQAVWHRLAQAGTALYTAATCGCCFWGLT